MAFVEIINNHGSTLIDDDYENLVLAYKMTVTLNNVGNSAVAVITVNSRTGKFPLVALSAGFYCAIASVSFDGAAYRYVITAEQSAIGGSVAAYVFTVPDDIPNLNGLVQLRNAANQVTFDSNLKYFRLLYFKPPSMDWSDYPLPVGKVCAFIPLQPGFRSLSRNENPTPPPWRYVVTDDYFGYRFSANTLQGGRFISQIQTRTSNQALPEWAQSYASPASGVMLVDITGY